MKSIFQKRADVQNIDPGVVLLLQVPRDNNKKELAAEQMLAAIHGLLSDMSHVGFMSSAEHQRISFEIAAIDGRIGFYIWSPESLQQYIKDQVYAQYPDVHISQVNDYVAQEQKGYMIAQLKLTAPDPLPIKTFPSFDVDPLAGITATLAQLEIGENAAIQIVIEPAYHNWHKKSQRYAANIRGGSSMSYVGVLGALVKPPESSGVPRKLAEHETARANAAEEKSHKLAYSTTIRVLYLHKDMSQARMRLQSIIASFKQFNSSYLNGFTSGIISADEASLRQFAQRTISRKPMTLNIEELASVYHLPHTNVETPNILWANAATAEPPANLPVATDQSVSTIAHTNFRGHNTVFGLPRSDRGRHVYIIGQTGTGKSGLLELLTVEDIKDGQGFAVIDPHGDYALHVLKNIPEERIKDVIYFNPADSDYPIAFNPLEVYDPKLRTHTCSELIGVLKRMFDSWGPRLEYILRYSILALLDYPGATMLDITRILTDKKFRDEVLVHVTDPVVKNFWTVEFASWNDKFAAEAIAPVLNKIGAFTANPLVRNIIGQPKGSFNVRRIMDEKKILIVNLSRGLIGEDNASLLGSLMVTKIQMAAMSRADMPIEDRTPFYLYVDEFQNFATDSFATILSEARKYGLNLTVANQYTAQMMPSVRDAVFGNVGCIISFRTSADDARGLLKYFEPKFTDHDLVHMHNRSFIISMTIKGEKVAAFSAVTTDIEPAYFDYTENIISNSREEYAQSITRVAATIQDRYHANKKPKQKGAKDDLYAYIKSRIPETHSDIASPESKQEKAPKVLKKHAVVAALGEIAEKVADKPKRKRKRSHKKKRIIQDDSRDALKKRTGIKNLTSEGELKGEGTIKLR